jgi:transcriptional antiterminator RfaH
MTGFHRPPRPRKPSQPYSQWGVVRTKPGQEAVAKLNVERQGLKAFLPKARESGRATLSPLFPGYLFVCIADRWSFLNNTIGVSRLLMDGDRPARVPRKVMKQLRAEQGKQGFIDLRDDTGPLSPGDPVIVKRGAFVSFKAVYISTAPNERVKLLMEFLGGKVDIELRRRDIARAGDNPGE